MKTSKSRKKKIHVNNVINLYEYRKTKTKYNNGHKKTTEYINFS